jgi:hypothetical protein
MSALRGAFGVEPADVRVSRTTADGGGGPVWAGQESEIRCSVAVRWPVDGLRTCRLSARAGQPPACRPRQRHGWASDRRELDSCPLRADSRGHATPAAYSGDRSLGSGTPARPSGTTERARPSVPLGHDRASTPERPSRARPSGPRVPFRDSLEASPSPAAAPTRLRWPQSTRPCPPSNGHSVEPFSAQPPTRGRSVSPSSARAPSARRWPADSFAARIGGSGLRESPVPAAGISSSLPSRT